MNPKRVGEPYANDISAQPKKKFKEAFSSYQAQGRIIKTGTSNDRTSEILYTNFVNEFPVDTALVGDCIVDNVCMNGVLTFSRGGGIISDFYSFIPTLKSYPKIIILVGGNNLSHYGKPGESPEDVLEQLKSLREAILKLEHKPQLVLCTVLRRLKDTHDNLKRFNKLLENSDIPSFSLHRQVFKRRSFVDDGVHLTLKGRRNYACGMKKLRKAHFGDDVVCF